MSEQIELPLSELGSTSVVPSRWAWARLVDLAAPEPNAMTDGPFGSKLKTSHYVDSGVRVVRLGNLGAGEFKDSDRSFVSSEHAESLERHKIEEGDLLIAALAEPVGRCCQAPSWILPAIVKADCIRFRPSSEVDARFLMHWLNSPVGQKNAERHSHGVGRLRINMKNMRSLEVPVAPLPEQRRIVAETEKQFTRLDAAVANLERVKANLKRARASVLKAAVEGRLVPTEASLAHAEGRDYEPASVLLERILEERERRHREDNPKKKYNPPVEPDTAGLPALPEGWTWASPEQICDDGKYSLAIGPFGSNLRVPDYRDEGVPLVFVRNIRSGDFSGAGRKFVEPEKAAELRAHQCHANDVLITKMGDPPGDAWVYPPGCPPAVVTADVVKWTISSRLALPWFICFATRASAVHGQILQRTKGVAQKKISLARFASVAYPLPPRREQARIVAEIQRKFSVLEKLEAVIEANLVRCSTLRQSILKRAFEGKLVPQDPNDEPASALLERIQAEAAATKPKKKRAKKATPRRKKKPA